MCTYFALMLIVFVAIVVPIFILCFLLLAIVYLLDFFLSHSAKKFYISLVISSIIAIESWLVFRVIKMLVVFLCIYVIVRIFACTISA